MLRGAPLPRFLENGSSKISETFRADRSLLVHQKLCYTRVSIMLPSMRYRGHKDQKWPHFVPRFSETLRPIELKRFLVTRTKSGCMFFFFEIYFIVRLEESKYWKSCQKTCFFAWGKFCKIYQKSPMAFDRGHLYVFLETTKIEIEKSEFLGSESGAPLKQGLGRALFHPYSQLVENRSNSNRTRQLPMNRRWKWLKNKKSKQ